ncbi:hypothetical protein A5740_05540 [Mycobacterium sp. GA-1841]|nr:hypothetical protein A5740_05540 [Mycobacterium sp. GA-1841]
MFRTTIAQIVQDKGSEAAKSAGTLNKAIKQMVADRALFEDFGDWAHRIRTTGNAGAHGEAFDPVTQDQAAELKVFIRELINFLYVQPARRAAARPATRKADPAAGRRHHAELTTRASLADGVALGNRHPNCPDEGHPMAVHGPRRPGTKNLNSSRSRRCGR